MDKSKQLLGTKIKSVLSAKRITRSPYGHILLVAGVLFSIAATVEGQDGAKTRKATTRMSVIVFVCEHGAAKSVIAAAHFNKLAGDRNLNVRAISRGTNPDEELGSKTVEGLQADGLTVPREKPTRLSEDDVSKATLVVAFCELPEAYRKGRRVEQWNDVPAVSEDYGKARDAIVGRVKHLLYELGSAK
jgi:arsenate reductase